MQHPRRHFGKMASGLSEDEFQRMQMQLLELREQNYHLSDSCKRHERDNGLLRSQVEALDKDLQKASRAITKSKKIKEVEIILQDNENLQMKLQSQEEDFRLQNETLMTELGSLVSTNESLERENASLKDGSSIAVQEEKEATEAQNEFRHLQAQNAALQKNLAATQDRYEDQLSGLRHTIADLETQCIKLSGQRTGPVGEVNERSVEGQADLSENSESQLPAEDDNIEDAVNDNDTCDTSLNLSKTDMSLTSLDEALKQMNDLRLNLDIEKEEKNMLKDQLGQVEGSYREQLKTLQEEMEKLSDKYKKKQESLLQLQDEKEKIYAQLSHKLDDTSQRKEREIGLLQDQIQRMQQELNKVNKNFDVHKERAGHRLRELDHMVQTLRGQVDTASVESSAQLQEQNDHFRQKMAALQEAHEGLQQEKEDLQVQLKESQRANHTTLEQLYDSQQERDKNIQALQEANKVAEKRKSLLDELAIKYQSETDNHRQLTKAKEEEHATQIRTLEEKLDDLQNQVDDLTLVSVEADDLRTKVAGLEEARGWLERRLTDTEETFEKTKQEHEASLKSLQEEHNTTLNSIREEHALAIAELEERITSLKSELDVKDDEVTKLKQDVKDGLDARKTHEKKGASLMKDLKRQLLSEKKRVEKLQERLQEILSDSKNRPTMEELLKQSAPSDRGGETSSVVSSISGGTSRDPSIPMSTGTGRDSPQGSSIDPENEDIESRLIEVQTQCWMLAEKVTHLEQSNGAMAEDILQKTAVIQHYAMESRINDHANNPINEKMTLKRVVDFVMDKGDTNLKEINQKVMRMLEETLTKNMHLEKDLEALSQEVVRLSKFCPNAEPVQLTTTTQ